MAASTGAIPVVLDTNIIVSSLLSGGNPGRIIDLITEGRIKLCFDDRILAEYLDVLSRPKFGFPPIRVNLFIHDTVRAGFSIDVPVPSRFAMPDESDRKFYDAAKTADAILITGNIKHYPPEPFILTPAAFLQRHYVENECTL